MQRKTLALFPTKPNWKGRKENQALKENEKVVEVFAAGIVQITANKDIIKDGKSIAGCQINHLPGLFAESEMKPYRKGDKTKLRKFSLNSFKVFSLNFFTKRSRYDPSSVLNYFIYTCSSTHFMVIPNI